MAERLGILVSPWVLRRAVRGRPVYERVDLYVREARKLGLEVVLFDPEGWEEGGRRIRGFVFRRGAWRHWDGSLPPVVHNRLLPLDARSRRVLRQLVGLLPGRVFNPPVSRDKWRVWHLLSHHPSLREHLPPTWRLTPERCKRAAALVRRYGALVAKPRLGGVGLGVICIEAPKRARGDYRWVPPNGRVRRLSADELVRRLRRRLRSRYVLQAAIPLAEYRGRRFDIRVPVQRDGAGQWVVPGAAVKRAGRHPFLTNLSRGGEAHPCREVLAEVFGDSASDVWQAVHDLALAVAEALAERHPGLADLGLDVGVDRDGKPWLIEVNLRDQRWSLRAAGDSETFADLYANPVRYARHLLARVRTRRAPAGLQAGSRS